MSELKCSVRMIRVGKLFLALGTLSVAGCFSKSTGIFEVLHRGMSTEEVKAAIYGSVSNREYSLPRPVDGWRKERKAFDVIGLAGEYARKKKPKPANKSCALISMVLFASFTGRMIGSLPSRKSMLIDHKPNKPPQTTRTFGPRD